MDNKTQERIKADAEAYALPMVWVNQNPKGEEQLFYEYISSTSYIAGATAECEFTKKAMILLKIIVSRFQGAAEMADQDYDKGLLTKCRNLIEQWKGKEVEPPKPVASNCGMCGKLGNNQYLGNQFYLCDECFEDYEKGRDQPTPY